MPTPCALVKSVRAAAGLFEGPPCSFLAIQGGDRVPFLHRTLTHDIKGLQAGQGRPVCLLDRQGKILFAAFAFAGPDALWLTLAPEQLRIAQEGLSRYLVTEEAQISDATASISALSLHGPASAKILQEIWPELSLPLKNLNHAPGPPGSALLRIVRQNLLGLPGFTLWVRPEGRLHLIQSLLVAGKPWGIVRADEAAFHSLRIEAGVPWPGAEMNDTVILNELGSEDYVSFAKGCFVGQEIVARIKYRAHPPRLLSGFLPEGQEVPPERSRILKGEDSSWVGVVTSACLSPTLGKVIALGFLKFGEEGPFFVKAPQGLIPAVKTPLPFVIP
ncbi:MAG: aminomethyl transferase family protein [Candidatus Omnitrophica bacterium]|nr:aminomethyl transferase family protein [Candidatus Omnitrophota bacterium]